MAVSSTPQKHIFFASDSQFCYRMSKPPGPSAARRIRRIEKIFSHTVGSNFVPVAQAVKNPGDCYPNRDGAPTPYLSAYQSLLQLMLVKGSNWQRGTSRYKADILWVDARCKRRAVICRQWLNSPLRALRGASAITALCSLIDLKAIRGKLHATVSEGHFLSEVQNCLLISAVSTASNQKKNMLSLSKTTVRSTLRAGPALPQGRFLVLIPVRGWVIDTRAYSAAGRIRWTENANDPFGTRTREQPACYLCT
jgi:hypothetical protein